MEATPDLKNIYSVFDGVQEYVSTYCISYVSSNKVLLINVEFLSFDLIDEELDFNEIYYEKMKSNIMDIIVSECMKIDNIKTVEIYQSLKLMQRYTKLQKKITISPDKVVTENYR
jgi:hypothetical protein